MHWPPQGGVLAGSLILPSLVRDTTGPVSARAAPQSKTWMYLAGVRQGLVNCGIHCQGQENVSFSSTTVHEWARTASMGFLQRATPLAIGLWRKKAPAAAKVLEGADPACHDSTCKADTAFLRLLYVCVLG